MELESLFRFHWPKAKCKDGPQAKQIKNIGVPPLPEFSSAVTYRCIFNVDSNPQRLKCMEISSQCFLVFLGVRRTRKQPCFDKKRLRAMLFFL